MTTPMHLTIEQLLALRDGDRSEPAFATASRHLEGCATCRGELEALHQRTARLRALATMAPATDQFPAIRTRLHWEQSRRRRILSFTGMAAAAALVIGFIGSDLVAPPALTAEDQIATAISRSQALEQTLHTWGPDARVMDGRMAMVVIELEDRIADVDARLQDIARLQRKERMTHEVSLWQERVGLMNALVDVHLTKATNVDL